MFIFSLIYYYSVLDPRQWTEVDVTHWLNWAIREFSLEGVNPQNFTMRGKDMCALGKESFLARTPPYMGDILWEHLDILQKGITISFLTSILLYLNLFSFLSIIWFQFNQSLISFNLTLCPSFYSFFIVKYLLF